VTISGEDTSVSHRKLNLMLYKLYMKKNNWILYLFENDEKRELFKIMEFKTIKDVAFVLDMDAPVISNWFHGLINPRGILKNCVLHQSIVL